MEKIKVEAKFGYTPVEDVADIDLEPSHIIFDIKSEGKNGYESTIKIPIGQVSSEEFARAVKALHLSALAFHHNMYSHLKEEVEERENFPPLIKKDQRGA